MHLRLILEFFFPSFFTLSVSRFASRFFVLSEFVFLCTFYCTWGRDFFQDLLRIFFLLFLFIQCAILLFLATRILQTEWILLHIFRFLLFFLSSDKMGLFCCCCCCLDWMVKECIGREGKLELGSFFLYWFVFCSFAPSRPAAFFIFLQRFLVVLFSFLSHFLLHRSLS